MMAYTVIDALTGEPYGPFESLSDERRCAEALDNYEILNGDDAIIEWECRPKVLGRV